MLYENGLDDIVTTMYCSIVYAAVSDTMYKQKLLLFLYRTVFYYTDCYMFSY